MVSRSAHRHVSCFGYSDGGAVVTVRRRSGLQQWRASNATGIFNAVPAGDAMITVTDAQGLLGGHHRDRATPTRSSCWTPFCQTPSAALVSRTRS